VTDTDTDRWPTPDADTALLYRDRDTVVGGPPPPQPPPPPPSPDRGFGAGMVLAIVAIALAAAGVAIAYFLTHDGGSSTPATTTVIRSTAPRPVAVQKVAVPRVIGLKEQPALVRLAQLGLRPKEVYRETRQPKGVVVSQKPKEATEVKKGSQVRIVIDSGAPKVAVPDLGGKSFADARAALDKLGLDSTRTPVTSTEPAGTVVDQAPKAGAKLAKGSTITLSVARASASTPTSTTGTQTTTGAQTTSPTTTATSTAAAQPAQPQNATMPDVSQQTEAAAAKALSDAGILASIAFVPGEDPLGTVLQQAKSAGTSVPYHSHVQINVSRGPGDKPDVQVPSVIGQTLDQAVPTLNGAKLRLIYVKFPVSDRSKAGKIVQQSPLGGGKAPQNAQVLVFVGAFRG
jgi:beta-lactam-binding protein with PASTA domain